MINKKNLTRRTGKTVLLFSSGMDSYIINQLEKPDVLLFIDNKSNYSKLEMKYLKELNYPELVFVEDFIDMSSIELDNMIIPGRNLYFVMIAAMFGEEIILGATAGDRSTDKDHKFAELSSDLLSHIYSKSHWCDKGDIFVNLKYKYFTKQMLVNALVRFNEDRGIHMLDTVNMLLSDSFSCYYPILGGRQCNKCKPDIRKWLSILGATGVNTDYHYDKDNQPSDYFTSDRIAEWIEDHTGDNSRGRESVEILETLSKL